MKAAELRTAIADWLRDPLRHDDALFKHRHAVLDLMETVRAYIDSEDDDRIAEHDAMVAALERVEAIKDADHA